MTFISRSQPGESEASAFSCNPLDDLLVFLPGTNFVAIFCAISIGMEQISGRWRPFRAKPPDSADVN